MPPKKRKNETENDPAHKKGRKKLENSNGSHAAPIESDITEDGLYADFKLEAPDESGELLFSGCANWDMVGRNRVPNAVKNNGGKNLYTPHRIASLQGIRIRMVVAGCSAAHLFAITTEGKVYSWGRNEKGQLGHGDTERKDKPSPVESLFSMNVIDGAVGKNHTIFLTDKGRLLACGDNKMGQLGLGHQSNHVPSPTLVAHSGPPIKKVACGGEFSMAVDIRGNLYSFGHPEHGQLGHNTDGKYFITSNKLAYNCELKPRKVAVFIEKSRDGTVTPVLDVEIEQVACGVNHTLACDSKKRLYTWGFGGYGRLGHAEPKNELVPRLVKAFQGPNQGVSQIQCGSQFSLAVGCASQLYMWGQQKPTGEATMYPKPVQDLSGWNVRSIGCCYKSIVVAADESVVSWGPSPTFGELASGEPKSCTTPSESRPLENIYIKKVACGFSHSLFLARDDEEEDKKRIASLPVFDP